MYWDNLVAREFARIDTNQKRFIALSSAGIRVIRGSVLLRLRAPWDTRKAGLSSGLFRVNGSWRPKLQRAFAVALWDANLTDTLRR